MIHLSSIDIEGCNRLQVIKFIKNSCYYLAFLCHFPVKAANSNWQERHVILGCIRLGSASSGIHPNTRKVVEHVKLCKGSWCQASPKLRFAKISETQRKWCILHVF
ncbi:hypothetical protein BDA96_02G229800 [Sorghum bicolor]|uniref:Uncharacterized protein n=1 Tax=Sorghum bicolor TaxID=4558 RepID=A0A921UTS4_SORBI|nr:hypothetical protein BDA96_02G229800 [Sorghum bicolor]